MTAQMGEIKQMSDNGLKFLMNNESVNIRRGIYTQNIPQQSGIYKITSPSGRIYIGQAINLRNRKWEYNSNKCKTQRLLYKSIIKYGINNHIFSVLELCGIEKLHEREIYYIDLYKSNKIRYRRGNGLNLTDGGQGSRGYKHTEESLIKMSKFQSKRINSPESNKKRSDKLKGRKISEKTLAAVSRKKTPEHIFKIISHHFKKVINTETGFIYQSAKDAALAEGYNYSTFKWWLRNEKRNKTKLKYA